MRPQPLLYLSLNLDYPGLRRLKEKPPIYLVEDFLTHDECDTFIKTATPLLQRSKTHAAAGESRCAEQASICRPDVTPTPWRAQGARQPRGARA